MEMGPMGSPKTSVSNHLTTGKNPEDGRIPFNRGGRLGYGKYGYSCAGDTQMAALSLVIIRLR